SGILGANLGSLSYLIVFLAGSYLVKSSIIEVGAVVSLIQLMNYLVDPVVDIVALKSTYEAAKPIYEKLNIEDTVIETGMKSVGKNDLVISNLNFSYGNKNIIENFNYRFKYGKKYLITGDSGKGKTTLLRILAGELDIQSGSIYLIDKNNLKKSNDCILGYQNQESKLVTGTIYENISFYRNIDNENIEKLKKEFDLESNLSRNIETKTDLSGGEKTRISLIRALVEPKNIMIFDEPTTGLNKKLEGKVIEKILSLDSTVIMVSHLNDKEFLSKFDEVIEL
ncbi:MAG: ABC transporter ATP-binding protein, partial [Helcococcus sp.]|nr:ABC transporter ATP-binding protein [Helcococcus sp.]